MRAYLQANVGTTAVVDEEIGVCTARNSEGSIKLSPPIAYVSTN